jgi:V8-like Glu-specific endopeptidase
MKLKIAAALLVGFSAEAAMSMEAQVTCLEGFCGMGGRAFAENSANLEVKKIPIDVFPDAQGIDPRSSESPFDLFSPVGHVTTNKDQLPPAKPGQQQVVVAANSIGTGYMIAPCFMQTNTHAAVGPYPVDNNIVGTEVTFEVGNPSTPFKGTIVKLGTRGPMGSNDAAIVEFPAGNCPGERADVGYFDFAKTAAQTLATVQAKVTVAGFPMDVSAGKISVQRDCEVTAITVAGTLLTNCGVLPGSSGSPVLVASKSGVPIAVATIAMELGNSSKTIAYKKDHSNANIAVPMSQSMDDDDLLKRILDDRKRILNPLLQRVQKNQVQPMFKSSSTTTA